MRLRYTLSLAVFASGMTALAGNAAAQSCSVDIGTDDTLQFDTDTIVVDSSCDEFTVNLTHTGVMDHTVMGHNWVLAEPEAVEGVARDGLAAGIVNQYVVETADEVIAATDIIGGGEETSVTFDVDELEEGAEYTYFCSFPGHSAVMRGTLTVE